MVLLDLFAPARGVTFFLGTHEPSWLARTAIPLFVARQRFARTKRRPRALGTWALDSGGFTQLAKHAAWTIAPPRFVEEVEAIACDVGNMEWAAPQDWMCEPQMLARTGLTIEEHQRRTVANVLEVRALSRSVHFVPVLQGWTASDYLRCVEMYARAGVDLLKERVVGLGTVCRRQATKDAKRIVRAIRAALPGIRLHGFGFKKLGLAALAGDFLSADSLAWSYNARKNPPLPGHRHKNCNSCLEWALRWRADLAERVLLAGAA